LEDTRSQIYATGPGIQVLTKFGLFDLRYYDEFAAKATPSGQQLMFSVTLAGTLFSCCAKRVRRTDPVLAIGESRLKNLDDIRKV
jgi:hypothetical protein